METTSNKITLYFETETGAITNITVNNSKENITLSEVESIAEDIISENVFFSQSGDLKDFKYANITKTTTKKVE